MCGKWKMLTRRYMRALVNGADGMSSMTDHIIGALADVLLVSGANVYPQEMKSTVAARFGDKVAEIVTSSLAMQKATGEKVVSADMHIDCPIFDVKYADMEMEDVNDNSRRHVAGRTYANVLCTTELGLRRSEKHANGVQYGSEDITNIVMLKARVALRSLEDELTPGKLTSVSIYS